MSPIHDVGDHNSHDIPYDYHIMTNNNNKKYPLKRHVRTAQESKGMSIFCTIPSEFAKQAKITAGSLLLFRLSGKNRIIIQKL